MQETDLTEEEIKLLADAINSSAPHNDECNGDTIDMHFSRAMEYVRENPEKFFKMSIEDIFKWFYELGVNTDVKREEMSVEEVFNIIENAEFARMIQKCMNGEIESNTINVNEDGNQVKLVSKCEGHDDCPAWPDRCEDCGGDGEYCSITIPMKRFNQMLGIS